ncbi:hypothetical protein TBS_31110 [Thermobispora bispora]|jgi:hypothetical protein|uniref:DUF6542 domain-containing protein n=1 Tax=Thermobispora bispora (strain ATCC 19993 / DSM 43833 / CBS 139.67 / JCM 10125 / KCTC 9307 / NBRC 14880 / R51) TaxID=469371 RepID=D6Y7P8_THEBD|nr:DUF6542 domain-containing protein [Thermobispora bispora]MBO2473889.1 hypothetical protein [Actinomycetales bacterium]MDI9581743.1 hypothetical protein [Thermobispora sp.]ADG89759.1 hypothetical protein Tbis_3064 [Thermobispora bispora DSM 43833]MBX6166261.1 hypothetical protein [Thermobispora bispora]QSI49350.1 hypothetical protein CYL17_17045 [Thermobispora bispora]
MTGTDQPRLRLTARGAVVVLFMISLLGQFLAPGPVFVIGCVTVVLLVHRRDLLALAVTPPLVFFCAALFVEFIRALGSGSMLQALGLGLFTTLSSAAPWLFLGSALTLVLAWPRGLPANVRELRRELSRGANRPGAGKRRGPRRRNRRRGFDPEPEGYFEPRLYGRAIED